MRSQVCNCIGQASTTDFTQPEHILHRAATSAPQMRSRREARPQTTRAQQSMNFPKYIFGGVAAQCSLAGRSSVFQRTAAILSRLSKLAVLAVAICLPGSPHPSQAASPSKQSQDHQGILPTSQCVATAQSGIRVHAALPLQSIPEPQTWITAFAGLGTLLALQRFRRTRS